MRLRKRDRRTGTRGGLLAEQGADYGPSLRAGKDGRLRTWGGAVVVELESRDDPEVVDHRRVVRGARRRDVLADLEARSVITKRHVDAAAQFLDDCSIASGASACGITGMPAVHGMRAGLPERQVEAITRINRVRLLLGLNAGTVFWWVIFQGGGVREWELQHRVQTGQGSAMLRTALDALDNHYHGSHKSRT